MAIYVKEPTPSEVIFHSILQYISGVTYYLSATINPILYSIMSVKFRQAFKDTFVRCCTKQRTTNRFGKFVGSTSSYGQIRFNSAFRTTISRTELTQFSDGVNGNNLLKFETNKNEEMPDSIPLTQIYDTKTVENQ